MTTEELNALIAQAEGGDVAAMNQLGQIYSDDSKSKRLDNIISNNFINACEDISSKLKEIRLPYNFQWKSFILPEKISETSVSIAAEFFLRSNVEIIADIVRRDPNFITLDKQAYTIIMSCFKKVAKSMKLEMEQINVPLKDTALDQTLIESASEAKDAVVHFYIDNFNALMDLLGMLSPDKAYLWFKRAAERGNYQGMINLGKCYINGIGVEQDLEEAINWLTKVCNNGNQDESKIALGLIRGIKGEQRMQTTNKIFNTLQAMLQAMFKQSKEKNQDCVLTEDMLTDFHNLANENPVQNPFFLSDLPSTKEVESLFANIERHAGSAYTMPYMPISYFKDNIQGKDIYTPAFLPWQAADNKVKNFIINYDNSTAERAAVIYKHMVMSILLGLPPKSVHLSFVNTQLSPLANFFTAPLDESLYDKVSSSQAYHQLLDRLLKRVMDFGDKYAQSIEQVNEASGKIVENYEVVVLLDDPDAEISAQDQLIPLFEKGPMYGIYFIGLNSTEKVSKRDDQDNILKHTDCYHVINAGEVNSWKTPQKNGFITTLSIANNNVWAKAAFDYINTAATKQIVHIFDWQTAVESPYTPTGNEVIAPIGFTEDGKPFNFQMDVNKQHYHAFVIGATGSGKSRFLHDVILSMTAKYQPEDVELYLLDFKGVEFNCYRGFKHTRAILVDRADERITYEVIKDIKLKMEQRQQLLAAAGASDVSEYNKMNAGKHLTQIVLVADECQTLFADRAKNGRLQNEMVDIIALIAQQGRAYGVHLLLSTQSLANAPQLGKEILNQIGEHYILPCLPADAARLVSNEKQTQTEKVVATMERGKGQCYYEGADGATLFTFNFVQKGKMQDGLVSQLEQKAASHVSNGQTYFSGALQFPISQEVADYIASKGRKNIVASPGQIISLEQTPLTISLKDDLSENIALFGINDRQFVTRTTIGLMTSLMLSNKQKDLGYQFLVFDCLDDEEAEYLDVLDELENANLCEVVAPRKRADKLKQLCDAIASNRAKPTILVILGQERFRELKLNQPIDDASVQPMDMSMPAPGDFAAALAAMNSIGTTSASASNLSGSSVKTVQEAMNYILSEGPANGVHTIIQVDKPNNFLFPQDGSLRKNDFYAKCKHVILLRSESTALTNLWLQDDISHAISQFEDNPSRLRAYYYNEEGDKYQLFTPFVLPDKNTINNIIK